MEPPREWLILHNEHINVPNHLLRTTPNRHISSKRTTNSLHVPTRSGIMVTMNRLPTERRAAVVRCLAERNSIRSTVRMTGVAKNTIVKLLVELGTACAEYQDRVLRDLPCQHVEAAEIWSFCNLEARNVPEERCGDREGGDVWTWTAIDPESKLVPTWAVGGRSAEMAWDLMQDLRSRLRSRVQLTTDGRALYATAVKDAFGADIEYAQLVRIYGSAVSGHPDGAETCASSVERQNVTRGMGLPPFTPLANAFSRKVGNLAAAVSLHFMYYNFARPHKGIANPYPRSPAMAAGVADHVWRVEEIVALLG